MNFFLAHCDICTTIQSPHFGFGKKRCFDEFFFKSCCCCVQEVLPQPCYSSLHYVGRSPKLLLTETITANPFSISWAFKLAHEMPCVLLLPLSTSVGLNPNIHSSEIRGLRSTFCPREMLQNLPYFMYKKTHVVFFVFHFVQL